jgi:homogentisate 1,2-dioxygenase
VQDYSPYDVAGWHGNYTPYVYDLMHFCPVGFTRFDHIDPSIFSVLSAPMDELGSHTLDFVFFPPRWDVSEHTFRPPYFHRNATTEINGIIHDPSLGEDSPFQPGSVFLTPSMTAHGVIDRGVERAFAESNEAADRPHRIGDGSMWFQFESALPLRLTPWARDPAHHRGDWTDIWGVYRTHFDPLARRANWK